MKKYLIISLAIFSIGMVGVIGANWVVNPLQANAQSSSSPSSTPTLGNQVLSGWAWSSTIGWISLNSEDNNTGNGGTGKSQVKYSINVDASGNMNGYAWSPNIGWVRFGGLSSFPDNTVIINAKIDTTTGKVTGWARACAGTVSGTCVKMDSRTDGWDGWISLSGVMFPSVDKVCTGFTSCVGGVFYNITKKVFNGFAWGNNVLGWVRFNANLALAPSATPTPATFSVTCSASPTSIPAAGGIVTFTATTNGGTGPYMYNWDTTQYRSDATYTKTYIGTSNSTNAGATLIAKDSTGATTIGYCSNIKQGTGGDGCVNGVCPTNIPVANPGLSLSIGSSDAAKSNLTDKLYTDDIVYKVRKGGLFGLRWKNTVENIQNNIKCKKNITPNNSIPSGWSAFGNSSDGYGDSYTTNDAPSGIYTFSIFCSDQGGTEVGSTHAILRIYTVSQGEK